MAEARRVERLEQVILQTVAPLIAYGLADPRLTDNMVTITRVRLSKDLSIARVNWSCIGGGANRSKAEHALENARGQVQSAIADAMRTRVTPRVHFHYDETVEKAARVNGILADLARERAEREGPEEDELAESPEESDASDDPEQG
jgi:ribosome-binding factor A